MAYTPPLAVGQCVQQFLYASQEKLKAFEEAIKLLPHLDQKALIEDRILGLAKDLLFFTIDFFVLSFID